MPNDLENMINNSGDLAMVEINAAVVESYGVGADWCNGCVMVVSCLWWYVCVAMIAMASGDSCAANTWWWLLINAKKKKKKVPLMTGWKLLIVLLIAMFATNKNWGNLIQIIGRTGEWCNAVGGATCADCRAPMRRIPECDASWLPPAWNSNK